MMLFEQDDKLCKQDIKSFEQHIKMSERVKIIKTRMSLPGSRSYLNSHDTWFVIGGVYLP